MALALQPVATALFANSPFFEGKPNGHKILAVPKVWRDLDADRTGMLPFVFEDGFGFDAWVDYALDVPMYFVYRDGEYINALGQSFRDFLDGKLPAHAGRRRLCCPTGRITSPRFSPKRGSSNSSKCAGRMVARGGRLCALPALWVGLTL